ncbi:MAG: hypothetical protein AAGJ08_16375 [Cyanobacteria bacterium P01_H01_bin.35]
MFFHFWFAVELLVILWPLNFVMSSLVSAIASTQFLPALIHHYKRLSPHHQS